MSTMRSVCVFFSALAAAVFASKPSCGGLSSGCAAGTVALTLLLLELLLLLLASGAESVPLLLLLASGAESVPLFERGLLLLASGAESVPLFERCFVLFEPGLSLPLPGLTGRDICDLGVSHVLLQGKWIGPVPACACSSAVARLAS